MSAARIAAGVLASLVINLPDHLEQGDTSVADLQRIAENAAILHRFAEQAIRTRSGGAPPGPGHRVHTDDCMSDWAERGRAMMTAATIAANHRLHMSDAAAADAVEHPPTNRGEARA
jgi:hypothetical protein